MVQINGVTLSQLNASRLAGTLSMASVGSMSTQFFSSTETKILIDGTLDNDRFGRWSLVDTGSGSDDALQWDGNRDIDLVLSMQATVENRAGAGDYTRIQFIPFVGGSAFGDGVFYADLADVADATGTFSMSVPVSLSSGDQIWCTGKIQTGSSGATDKRLAALSYRITIHEKW